MQISKVISRIVDKKDLVKEVEGYSISNTLTSISKVTKDGPIHAVGGGMKDTYLITVYIRKEKVNV